MILSNNTCCLLLQPPIPSYGNQRNIINDTSKSEIYCKTKYIDLFKILHTIGKIIHLSQFALHVISLTYRNIIQKVTRYLSTDSTSLIVCRTQQHPSTKYSVTRCYINSAHEQVISDLNNVRQVCSTYYKNRLCLLTNK